MKMTEARMFLPVKRWLERQGFQVFGELPIFYQPVDVVACKGNELVCIELKMNLTKKVIRQAAPCQLVTDRAYVGIHSKPRNVDQCRKLGLGVLRIHGAQVDVLLEPQRLRGGIFEPRHKRMVDMCQRAQEAGHRAVGGVPCQAGVGLALEMEAIIKSYRRKHPKATWRELYEKIPNHYASANSMRSAMDSNRQRHFIREHLKKEKAKVAV